MLAALLLLFIDRLMFFFRFQVFRSSLQALFSAEHAQTLPLERVVESVNKDYPDAKFLQPEINAAITRMTEDNHIMVSDGQVFLV